MATTKRARRTAKRRQEARRAEAARRRGEVRARSASVARAAYPLVAGERADLILDGLRDIRDRSWTEDGVLSYELVETPGSVTMGPCIRALMRVEAELMLRDADELTVLATMRLPEERRGDAFVLLARRACEAVRLTSGHDAAA